MKKIFPFIVLIIITVSAWAQSPKREMRATWLVTAWGIDWPNIDRGIPRITTTGNQTEINKQKNEMIRMLDSLVSANMNAVCFQVRSRADAMYRSNYEEWSSDLVISRGMDPGYDPLAFVLEEGHKRGLEVHAWVNPFRFESAAYQWSGLPGDFRVTHPDWILTAGGGAIFDPGLPEVRNYITKVVEDIITNYNVDGVLFDDYFYKGGIKNEDAQTYANHNPDGMTLENWRRDNINKFVKQVYDMIQIKRPGLRFGIGPQGKWGAPSTVAASYGLTLPPGIDEGGDPYDNLYCDAMAWLKQGTIDYLSPQVYWERDRPESQYTVLTPWWSNDALHFGRHCYISQYLSSLVPLRSTDAEYEKLQGMSSVEQLAYLQNIPSMLRVFDPPEIEAQVKINRESDKNDAPGSIMYSTYKFSSTTGFIDYLKKTAFTYKALPPAIHWKERINPGTVTGISLNGRSLSWSAISGNYRYSVYAIPQSKINDPAVFNSAEYLLGMTFVPSFTIPNKVNITTSAFAVAVLDAYGNEYAPIIMNGSPVVAQVPVLTYPNNGEKMLKPFSLSWNPVSQVISYILDIAEDAAFTKKLCSREVYSNSFSIENLKLLFIGTTYYWRVKTKTVGNESDYSEVHSFTITQYSPNIPEIMTPTNNAEISGNKIVVTWKNQQYVKSFRVELSNYENFPGRYTKIKTLNGNVFETEYTEGLTEGINYLRIRADYNEETALGTFILKDTEWSDTIKIDYRTSTAIETIDRTKNFAYIRSLDTDNKQLIVNLAEPATVSVDLYSVSGVKLSDVYSTKETLTGEQIFDIKTSGLPKGFYFLVLEMNGKKEMLKFFK